MRKAIILLFSLCCIFPINSFAAYFNASELGRLLTTPEQRHRIDALRKGKSPAGSDEKSSPSDIKMQGVVIRSDGKSTVWVNGKNTLKSNRVDGVHVRLNSLNNKTDTVTVVINNRPVRMKPGQVWSESSGKVTDGY